MITMYIPKVMSSDTSDTSQCKVYKTSLKQHDQAIKQATGPERGRISAEILQYIEKNISRPLHKL